MTRTPRCDPMLRAGSGACAGATAALVWAAAEPVAGRLLRTPYSDVRMLGRIAGGRSWRLPGLALHTLNGVLFGMAFVRLGGRGTKSGLAAAIGEHLLLFPGFAVIDRRHPDRVTGHWPSLTGRRVFVYETAMHALFGAVLGTLSRQTRVPRAHTPVRAG